MLTPGYRFRFLMIEVRQLSKTYLDPDGEESHAVSAANLTCNPGEVYGPLGATGPAKPPPCAAWPPL